MIKLYEARDAGIELKEEDFIREESSSDEDEIFKKETLTQPIEKQQSLKPHDLKRMTTLEKCNYANSIFRDMNKHKAKYEAIKKDTAIVIDNAIDRAKEVRELQEEYVKNIEEIEKNLENMDDEKAREFVKAEKKYINRLSFIFGTFDLERIRGMDSDLTMHKRLMEIDGEGVLKYNKVKSRVDTGLNQWRAKKKWLQTRPFKKHSQFCLIVLYWVKFNILLSINRPYLFI